jgi:hypothetical protein
VTTFIWFASGRVPLQIAVAAQLGITDAQASSATFIVGRNATAILASPDAIRRAYARQR